MQLLKWPHVFYIYLIILLGGAILNLIIPQTLKNWIVSNVYPFRHGNLINEVFAYHGNSIWNCLFVSLLFMNLYIRTKEWDPLISNHNHNNNNSINNKMKNQCIFIFKSFIIKFIMKNAILYILFLFIDRLFIFTGGSCQLDSAINSNIKSSGQCRSLNGQWVGGFDISGHFCFLINISLILWIELNKIDNWLVYRSVEWERIYKKNRLIQICHYMVYIILYVWIFLLFTTSTFYHKWWEKFDGYILGHACPLIMYYLAPTCII